MKIYENKTYCEDVKSVSGMNIPWEKLKNKSILISGATGLIGSFFIDVIMNKNNTDNLNCSIYALGRNEDKARERFANFFDDSRFVFVPHDVKYPLKQDNIDNIDFVLHLASNTHPLLYATDPIGTILTNMEGVHNLLEFAVKHNCKRFVLASSNEIYGENRGDVELFDEDYCGYINSNTLRAAYPESKRCGEALCQAYKEQEKIDVVIARLTRTYGPSMLMSDTKAISQFIKNTLDDKDVVLKSEGTQYYSYTYVADAVSGFLWVLLVGENGEAYNIADESGDIMLKDLAKIIAETNDKRVIFELPNEDEKKGFSRATKARLDGKKLKKLGWEPMYDIKSGVDRTIKILKDLYSN